jgi:hypothetical protein
MGLTNFPSGITSFGIPAIGGSQIPATTGSYFFVHSGTGSNGNTGTSPATPFATVDYAIGFCTASKGDVIVVMPGHAETLASAGAITCDVVGISIIGLGVGTNRPTFTFSATASTILVTANNVTLSNFNIASGVAELVTAFNVTTGTDCIIEKMHFTDSSTYTFISAITGAATALRINIRWNTAYTIVVPTGTAAFVSLTGACSEFRITDNDFTLARANNAASAAVGTLVAPALGVQIHRNNFIALGGTNSIAISLYAGTTGVVSYNNLFGPKTSSAGLNAPANCYSVQNFVTNEVAKSGYLDPAADSA